MRCILYRLPEVNCGIEPQWFTVVTCSSENPILAAIQSVSLPTPTSDFQSHPSTSPKKPFALKFLFQGLLSNKAQREKRVFQLQSQQMTSQRSALGYKRGNKNFKTQLAFKEFLLFNVCVFVCIYCVMVVWGLKYCENDSGLGDMS